jgi:hypothetical protein
MEERRVFQSFSDSLLRLKPPSKLRTPDEAKYDAALDLSMLTLTATVGLRRALGGCWRRGRLVVAPAEVLRRTRSAWVFPLHRPADGDLTLWAKAEKNAGNFALVAVGAAGGFSAETLLKRFKRLRREGLELVEQGALDRAWLDSLFGITRPRLAR